MKDKYYFFNGKEISEEDFKIITSLTDELIRNPFKAPEILNELERIERLISKPNIDELIIQKEFFEDKTEYQLALLLKEDYKKEEIKISYNNKEKTLRLTLRDYLINLHLEEKINTQIKEINKTYLNNILTITLQKY